MLAEIMKYTIYMLMDSGYFNHVELYEGQLEDLESYIIRPPHAFVEIAVGNNDKENYINLDISLNIYLCASHMKSKDTMSGMLNLIDNTINTLHNQNILAGSTYLDRLFFKSLDRLGIFPGLSIYKLTFNYGAIK